MGCWECWWGYRWGRPGLRASGLMAESGQVKQRSIPKHPPKGLSRKKLYDRENRTLGCAVASGWRLGGGIGAQPQHTLSVGGQGVTEVLS